MTTSTPILHFTHQSNLVTILDEGGLLCDRECRSSNLNTRNIAYTSLKQKRAETVVEVPPGGTLDDYVPFYFGPRSPMMLAYMNGKVTGRAEDQSELVYLVSHAETVAEQGLPFAFTDGHPIVEPRFFSNDLADLVEVDFDLMRGKYWFDTDAYPDRKRRRQAEFLVWQRMPLELIDYFVVMTAGRRTEIERMSQSMGWDIPCRVHSAWYY
ncbi:DUF4433 domain-containing protein [Micromonospora chersina]|uniref:type II toxin-antitoxin system toxin DNA ADP-ribosyl transferase DarT n=1 Tax=Micromonospora chersina TaxID=47854 RepID=UPI003716EF60